MKAYLFHVFYFKTLKIIETAAKIVKERKTCARAIRW